jgi:hypothetical protein
MTDSEIHVTFGDRTPRKRTATLPGDDSPDATQLILMGYPTACSICGSHTRIADTRQGWLCTNPACAFSTDMSV